MAQMLWTKKKVVVLKLYMPCQVRYLHLHNDFIVVCTSHFDPREAFRRPLLLKARGQQTYRLSGKPCLLHARLTGVGHQGWLQLQVAVRDDDSKSGIWEVSSISQSMKFLSRPSSKTPPPDYCSWRIVDFITMKTWFNISVCRRLFTR
ncbi:hypothetical protein CEXT_258161 [Caerostris extrusa]|uniref:Uncharacterized protein n=1 Tax=Caerostris extrusa TaxID=172846 RepID=A0AAV4P1V5_CAEEX|nr:hypothetical protein CEXT_258161 [Caerostris extrusa]